MYEPGGHDLIPSQMPSMDPMDNTMANVTGSCHVLFTKSSNVNSTSIKELNEEY